MFVVEGDSWFLLQLVNEECGLPLCFRGDIKRHPWSGCNSRQPRALQVRDSCGSLTRTVPASRGDGEERTSPSRSRRTGPVRLPPGPEVKILFSNEGVGIAVGGKKDESRSWPGKILDLDAEITDRLYPAEGGGLVPDEAFIPGQRPDHLPIIGNGKYVAVPQLQINPKDLVSRTASIVVP